MKKLTVLLVTIYFCLGATFAQADPFLVCDPMSDTNVTHFQIELNDELVRAEKHSINSTAFKIKYDIGDLAPGEYTARARSANEEWSKYSDWSSKITFTVPSEGDMPGCINFKKVNE